jgi:hypothetical protein
MHYILFKRTKLLLFLNSLPIQVVFFNVYKLILFFLINQDFFPFDNVNATWQTIE